MRDTHALVDHTSNGDSPQASKDTIQRIIAVFKNDMKEVTLAYHTDMGFEGWPLAPVWEIIPHRLERHI